MVGMVTSTALIWSCALGFFVHMNREVKYESMHDARCILERNNGVLRFSFVFVDSFLTITDYKLVRRQQQTHTDFYVTLLGSHTTKGDVRINKYIENGKEGRVELALPETSFDPSKDEFYYQSDGKTYRIPVQ